MAYITLLGLDCGVQPCSICGFAAETNHDQEIAMHCCHSVPFQGRELKLSVRDTRFTISALCCNLFIGNRRINLSINIHPPRIICNNLLIAVVLHELMVVSDGGYFQHGDPLYARQVKIFADAAGEE